MSSIREYGMRETEYKKLRFFASVCNDEFLVNKKPFYVDLKNIYFDFSQDWTYTALITENLKDDSSWQSVCPRDYENIVSSDSFSEIEGWAYDYAEALMNGKIAFDLTF